jgi:hypothetical protein
LIIRQFLWFLVILLIDASAAWSQEFERGDSSYLPIALSTGLNETKIADIELGQKASIYVGVKALIDLARGERSAQINVYENVSQFLDSASKVSDTVLVGNYYFRIRNSISRLLLAGNARVFYKKEHAFVDTIFHRFEKYGEHGDRFFYLPDKRPFFEATEMTGILDRNAGQFANHLEAYKKEGQKLASLRME